MNKNIIVGTPNQLSDYLKEREGQISRGLAKHIPFGKVLNFALTAVVDTPALRQCSITSFTKALIESVMLGLEPNTPLEQAYLIPYGNTVKLLVSYKGLITLAYNTDRVESLNVVNVFNDDTFSVKLGTEQSIEHFQDYDSDNYNTVEGFKGSYAVLWMRNARSPVFAYMTKKEIELIRARSKAKKSGTPWDSDYLEMAKKSVIKRVLKLLPKSSESQSLAHALNLDNQLESGKEQSFVTDIEFEEVGDKDVCDICDNCGKSHPSKSLDQCISESVS